MKTRYARQSNGRYHITSRMDTFLTIEPIGAELLTKTISPLLGKTADHNFTQTAMFVASLSRTAELNARSVRRLASQLNRVQPEVRAGFAEAATAVAQRAIASAAAQKIPVGTPLQKAPMPGPAGKPATASWPAGSKASSTGERQLPLHKAATAGRAPRYGPDLTCQDGTTNGRGFVDRAQRPLPRRS